MKRNLLLFLLLVPTIYIGILVFGEKIDTREVKIGNNRLFVEHASNEEERRKGLSGRTSLREDGGMLFSFGQENVLPSFWMKGMLIPIDIIWIDEWEVVKIHKNVQPEPEKSDSELTKYYSDGPIDNVIEVNAGFSNKNNIKVGDNVTIYR